jgi:carnosine N-methyltransferase
MPRGLARRSANYVPESDMEKLQSTLKQFVREWGAEGAAERDAAHVPALEALQRALPGGAARGDRVLLPGAGLGRLVWEVAKLGFRAQGSEFSYFMLLAANFVLNAGMRDLGSVEVHPWVLQTCNARSRADQMRGCTVPDTPPWALPDRSNLSMVAGDFLEVYREQVSCWDCVLTLFFIDTAHNFCHYLTKIDELLVPGGAWVNLGPLLWHFSDTHAEVSVDLTWEEVRALIVDYGFVIEHESWHRCPYVRNVRSMYLMEYDCVCFVARKPAQPPVDVAQEGAAPPPPPSPPPPPPPS